MHIYHIECHRNHKRSLFVAASLLAIVDWIVVAARIRLGNLLSADGGRPCPDHAAVAADVFQGRTNKRSRVHQSKCAPTCASPLLWPG